MRIFVGLAAPDNIIKNISDWQSAHQSLAVRWLRPEDLHLTLLPPWETADAKTAIEQFLALPDREIIKVNFNRLELGPNPRQPRLIWLAGWLTTPPLDNYLKILAYGLNQPLPERRFLPHLTIARFNSFQSPRDLNETIDWPAEFTHLTLYQSELTPQGVCYTVLAQKSLF